MIDVSFYDYWEGRHSNDTQKILFSSEVVSSTLETFKFPECYVKNSVFSQDLGLLLKHIK